MLDPNPGLIIWTIVTFLVVAFLLKKFAWKPLIQSLQQREEGIHHAIERAEQAKREAEQLLEENRKQLARAEQEGHRILAETRALAEKLKSEIVDSAHQQSRRVIDQAKQEIERDKDTALSQLRTEVANLAIHVAEKILGETLDDNKHRTIVDTYLKELPKN